MQMIKDIQKSALFMLRPCFSLGRLCILFLPPYKALPLWRGTKGEEKK